jgi:hypothetical protein
MKEGRRKIINLIKPGDVCAEIGVWKGEFSKKIIAKKPSELNLIDPWVHQDYDNRWYSIEQKKMDLIYENVLRDLGNLENVKIYKMFSTDVLFENDYFDFIYIDGNHSYEFVLKDLRHYYPFMKNESYIAGDDFGWTDKYCKKGPAEAVKDFCRANRLDFKVYGDQFAIKVSK